MWDWEVLQNKSGRHRYEILAQYSDENCQYTHALSYGSREDKFSMHNHAMYEIVYTLSGQVIYLVEGMRFEIKPRSLLIIHPTVPHKLFICSDDPYERHILYLRSACGNAALSALLSQYQMTMSTRHVGSSYYEDVSQYQVGSLMQLIDQTCMEKEPQLHVLAPYHIQSLLASILMAARRDSPTQYSTHVSKSICLMMEYINQNYTRDLTLDDIASHFYFSKDYCNRIFRKATGMTIFQYINYNRVLLARQMLSGNVSAGETAKRVGFHDYSSFYRTYKRVTGRTPQDDMQFEENLLKMPQPGDQNPD